MNALQDLPTHAVMGDMELTAKLEKLFARRASPCQPGTRCMVYKLVCRIG